MSILEYIKNLFSTDKKTANIYATTLQKKYGEKEPLEIALYDKKTPIINQKVMIEINKRVYEKTTDDKGVAKLNINLPVGKYKATIHFDSREYYEETAYATVIIAPNPKPTRMEGTNFTMNEHDGSKYQCAVYDEENNRIKDQVSITVNGVTYVRTADENGLYKLNINLNQGTYPVKAQFKGNDFFKPSYVNNTIIIQKKQITNKKDIILGCDANTENDKYVQDAIATKLKENGYRVEKLAIHPNAFASTDYSSKAKGKIGIYLIASGIFSIADAYYGSGQFDNYIFGIRGDFGDKGATDFNRPIRADADCTHICDELNGKTFNEMNSMLNPYVRICGGADIEQLGDNIVNWLNNIGESPNTPQPTPKPQNTTELHDYITEQGSGKLGQICGYSCGSHSLMQCIYRLTGIELSESKLMSVSGTTTDGVGHDGLETAIAWFNREYGYNIEMTWKNKSELSWEEIQSYIDEGAVFFHLLYRNSDGHYEVARDCDSTMDILNSLGERDGNGYYGYIEKRDRNTQQDYINGISQKSVCILKRR